MNEKKCMETDANSFRSEFVPVSCKYPLTFKHESSNRGHYFYFFIGILRNFTRSTEGDTQREYSSKPLKNNIVKRILVFKR